MRPRDPRRRGPRRGLLLWVRRSQKRLSGRAPRHAPERSGPVWLSSATAWSRCTRSRRELACDEVAALMSW